VRSEALTTTPELRSANTINGHRTSGLGKVLVAFWFVILMCLAFLVGCGGSGSSGATGTSTTSAAHLGCGQLCQTAGVLQGNDPEATEVEVDTSGTVKPHPDGTVPITVTCQTEQGCSNGALLLRGSGPLGARRFRPMDAWGDRI
jgi:hypothetical protein